MDNLYFYDIDMKNKELWFPEYETGLIFKGELKNYNFQVLGKDIYKIFKENPLFLGICSCKDKLILARHNDSNIIVYDEGKNMFLNYEVHNLPAGTALIFKHDSVFEYGNDYYIVLSYGEIICANQDLNYFEYILSVPNTKRKQCVCGMPEASRKIYIAMGNKVYAFLADEKTFLEVAAVKKDIETLCFDETSFWISTVLGELICLDKKEILYIEEEKMPMIVERPNARKFWKSFYCNNTIWLLPCYTEYILYADLKSKTIYPFVIEGEEENEESISRDGRKNKQKIISAIQISNELFVLSSKTEKLYKIDMVQKNIQNIELHFDKTALVYEKLQADKVWIEGTAGIGIKEYVELLGVI